MMDLVILLGLFYIGSVQCGEGDFEDIKGMVSLGFTALSFVCFYWRHLPSHTLFLVKLAKLNHYPKYNSN